MEKIDSVFAGFASSIFSGLLGNEAAFDCRCIPVRKNDITKYLVWRQAETFRDFNNAWARHALLKRGESPRSAAKMLSGLKAKELIALMKENKIDPDKLPLWQRRGILLYKEAYKKKGYDPIRKKSVIVTRHRVKVDWEPPAFNSKKGKKFLDSCISYYEDRGSILEEKHSYDFISEDFKKYMSEYLELKKKHRKILKNIMITRSATGEIRYRLYAATFAD